VSIERADPADRDVEPRRVTQTLRPLPSGAVPDQLAGGIPREPPGFQPRADLLAELDRAGAGVSVVHAVAGMRGVGKTQLAAAYARARLAEGWRLVAWVSAENTGTLRAGLAAVADAAGLAEGGSRPDGGDLGLAVRRQLETDGDRCLIVFDNVTDPAALRPYVPADGAAQILITSYQAPDATLGASIPVDVFSAGEALALLAGQTGLADDASAAAVAAELGRLPLALTQAATVIAGEHLGYETYLDRLRKLPVQEDLIQEPEQPYPPGTAEAVLLSLDAMRAGDQAGICTGLMEIMAVLSGAGVRRELLHTAGQAGVLISGGQRVTAALVDQALDQLAAWSLLTFSLDGQTIMAHRLVSQVIRDGLTLRDRLATVCRGTAAVLEARAQALAGSQDRLAVRDITEQVTALAGRAAPAAEADEELARILLRLRFLALYHLIELGDSTAQAVTVGEALIADLDRSLGDDHPDTLNTRNSLAAAYQAAGRPAEAIPLFEQTLVGRERLLGPNHPDTLITQNNLAAAYQDAGRVGEATLLFQLTLAARERLLGANDPSTLNSRGNLAAAYREAGRPAAAIPLLEQTLAGRERVLGADHPDTLHSRSSLAAAYRDAGRPAEAIPQLELILAARERLLGVDHPGTLSGRNNLAVAYRKAGKPAEAIPLFEQILAACERLYGADHPRTVATRKNLALAHQDADLVD
jgi:tetratricopeptide (TPR) repeat protein